MRRDGMVDGWEDGWLWALSLLPIATVWFYFETLVGSFLVIKSLLGW